MHNVGLHLKCWNDKSHCQVSFVGLKSLAVSPCNELLLLPMIIKNSLAWEYFFTHKSTFGVHYRTGSPGQLGLRVAGFPGHWVTKCDPVPSMEYTAGVCESALVSATDTLLCIIRGESHIFLPITRPVQWPVDAAPLEFQQTLQKTKVPVTVSRGFGCIWCYFDRTIPPESDTERHTTGHKVGTKLNGTVVVPWAGLFLC